MARPLASTTLSRIEELASIGYSDDEIATIASPGNIFGITPDADLRACSAAIVAWVRERDPGVFAIYVVQGAPDLLAGIAASDDPLRYVVGVSRVNRVSRGAFLVDGIAVVWRAIREHHGKGGRTKWYTVDGQSVQGGLERRYALALQRLGIRWQSCHKRLFRWFDATGNVHWYAPDFYLPDEDVYIEVKGFWTPATIDKMTRIYEETPRLRLRVVMDKDVTALERAALPSSPTYPTHGKS